MPKHFTDAQLARYRRDGYIFPLRVLSADQAAGYVCRLEAYEAGTGGPIGAAESQKSNLLFTWIDEIAHNTRLLDAIEDIIGPDILLWSTEFFIKEARSPAFVTWHQDDTYWHLDPPIEVTAWLALADVTPNHGPMRFIPGSHRAERPSIVNKPDPNNMLRSGQIAQGVDESKAVDAILRAGEISIHDTRTLHASKPNAEPTRRLGLVMRFVPTQVKQREKRETAMLVRGVDVYGHYDLEPRPRADLDPAAREAHRDAVARHMGNLFGTGYQAPIVTKGA